MKYCIIPVTAFQQNCTLLWCENTRRAAVVDPGGDISRIVEKLNSEQLILEKILLTHAHIDHAGGTAELAQAYNIPIEGPHIEDKFWIDAPEHEKPIFMNVELNVIE